MQAADTLDPSLRSTRKIESMSDLVAEMVLGACEDSESEAAAAADAAALAAARRVSIAAPPARAPIPSIDIEVDLDLDPMPAFRPSRGKVVVAMSGALVFVASAIAAFVTLR